MENFVKFQEIVLFFDLKKIAQKSNKYWDVSNRSATGKILFSIKTAIR